MTPLDASTRRGPRGFTLIDLLVSLAIVGTLATIAVPSTLGPILQARRTDAMTAIVQLQHAQERWRLQNPSYAGLAALALPATSPQGHYRLAVEAANEHGYTAVAVAQGLQQRDESCRVLRLEVTGAALRYGSGRDLHALNGDAENRRCWRL